MRPSIEKEKISQSIARLRTHGENFEIVIDPDNAIKFRHSQVAINEALMAPNVYRDIQSGELASEELMTQIFGSAKVEDVAQRIIKDGELHLNDEYKEAVRAEKKKLIVQTLMRDGAEAISGDSLTEKKIMHAFSQAKVVIDIFKSADEQLQDVINKIRPYLNVTLEKKVLQLRIPSQNAAKLYGTVTSKARILDENWLSDGSWTCRAEMPAGLVAQLIDELKSKTHGDIEANIEAKKR